MKKQLLNDEFIISERLDQTYWQCREAVVQNNLHQLHSALPIFINAMTEEIKTHFGTADMPRTFDPELVEIHRLAFDSYRKEMSVYLEGLAIFTTVAMEQHVVSLPFDIESIECYPTDMYCTWDECLNKSRLEQCIIGRKDWGGETPEDRQKEIEIKDNLNKHIVMQQALFDDEVFSKFTPKSFDQTDTSVVEFAD